jgi:hypothetical protein
MGRHQGRRSWALDEWGLLALGGLLIVVAAVVLLLTGQGHW